MRRATILVLLILLLAGGALAAEAKKTETQTVPLPRGSQLTIRIDDGNLSLTTWEREEAEIQITRRVWARSRREAERRLESIEVEIRRRLGEVEMVVFDREGGRHGSFWDLFNPEAWREGYGAWVEVELRVPEGTALWVEGNDLDVQLGGRLGKVTVRLDDGDIDVRDLEAASLLLDTDDGEVNLYRVNLPQGRASVATDDGRIRVEECRIGQMDTETGDADVAILRCDAEKLSVRTASGDVELEPDLNSLARLRVDTEDGDVVLALPPHVDAELEIETDTGRIRSELDLPVERAEEGGRIQARLGSGRARITIFTEDGDVILERR